jgi:hypothetical protein
MSEGVDAFCSQNAVDEQNVGEARDRVVTGP